MPEYRVFEKPGGQRVAINPELVEAVTELAGHLQIKLSSGQHVSVKKMALEEAIARLRGAAIPENP